MERLSYLGYIPVEIREIILSYLDYESFINYKYTYEPDLYKEFDYGILNIFKLKYPYLFNNPNFREKMYLVDTDRQIFLSYLHT